MREWRERRRRREEEEEEEKFANGMDSSMEFVQNVWIHVWVV